MVTKIDNEELNTPTGVGSRDPTRTITLRNRYRRAIQDRIENFLDTIEKTIIDNKALNITKLVTNQAREDFSFVRRQGLQERFERFIDKLARNEIIDKSRPNPTAQEENFQEEFILLAYLRGIKDAQVKARATGLEVAEEEPSNIIKRPKHQQALREAVKRNIEDLEDIVNEENPEVTRVLKRELAIGIAKGLSAEAIRQRINQRIKERVDKRHKNRARLLASTQVVRTYNDASLNRIEDLGISQAVGVAEGIRRGLGGGAAQGTWITAGDRRVCPRCLALEGRSFPISQLKGMLPLHPGGRCTYTVTQQANTQRFQERKSFAQSRLKEINLTDREIQQMNPLDPEDPITKKALSNFSKLRRGTL